MQGAPLIPLSLSGETRWRPATAIVRRAVVVGNTLHCGKSFYDREQRKYFFFFVHLRDGQIRLVCSPPPPFFCPCAIPLPPFPPYLLPPSPLCSPN